MHFEKGADISTPWQLQNFLPIPDVVTPSLDKNT